MLGRSQNYTLHLDDNSIYAINVKRPQYFYYHNNKFRIILIKKIEILFKLYFVK